MLMGHLWRQRCCSSTVSIQKNIQSRIQMISFFNNHVFYYGKYFGEIQRENAFNVNLQTGNTGCLPLGHGALCQRPGDLHRIGTPSQGPNLPMDKEMFQGPAEPNISVWSVHPFPCYLRPFLTSPPYPKMRVDAPTSLIIFQDSPAATEEQRVLHLSVTCCFLAAFIF